MDSARVPAGTIVVGIDGSLSSDAALSWAVEQAALEQRPLTIVHTLEPMSFLGAGFMAGTTGMDYVRLLDEAQKAARALVTGGSATALGRHPELTVNEVLNHGDPRTTLLGLAETAAVVVVGSRGRGPISSLLLGSVSVSVSKHAACPVVVHRPGPAVPSRHGVLVGTDGREHSLPAIEFAYRMASWRALPLTVLHCYWDEAPVAPLPPGAAVPTSSSAQALVSESIAGMQEKFPEVRVHVRLTRGFADQHLINASNNYDLIVIGHDPLSALDDLVHGSVASMVVEHAHGPVAVVPSLRPPADQVGG